MKNSLSKKQIFYITSTVAVSLLLYYLLFHYGIETTDDAFIEANVISLSPKVSGYVHKINVDDNQIVKAGDVIIEIEPDDYEVAYNKAAADLKSAEAQFNVTKQNLENIKVSAPSNLESAKSQLNLAKANWEMAVTDLNRIRKLGSLASTKQQLDNAITAEKVASSNLEDAKARLKSAGTAAGVIAAASYSVEVLSANVDKARAHLKEAENNLTYTKIVAPFNGRITKRSVELGTYVQPGQQLLLIVGKDLWVIANFKEGQLERIKKGQEVEISIDALKGKTFAGKVNSIQSGTGSRFTLFPPENATGNFVKIVQRVPVKITFDTQPDESLHIGPGMSVVPIVHVK